jgi:hypothetical protein
VTSSARSNGALELTPEQFPSSTDEKPISLLMVLRRLWDLICRRHKLHDNEPYGWAWKDLVASAGSGEIDPNFVGSSIDADDD